MKKFRNLLGKNINSKFYESIFKVYLTEYDVYLTLKAIYYMSYSDPKLMLIPIYQWKNLLIDFKIDLLVFTNADNSLVNY